MYADDDITRLLTIDFFSYEVPLWMTNPKIKRRAVASLRLRSLPRHSVTGIARVVAALAVADFEAGGQQGVLVEVFPTALAAGAAGEAAHARARAAVAGAATCEGENGSWSWNAAGSTGWSASCRGTAREAGDTTADAAAVVTMDNTASVAAFYSR